MRFELCEAGVEITEALISTTNAAQIPNSEERQMRGALSNDRSRLHEISTSWPRTAISCSGVVPGS